PVTTDLGYIAAGIPNQPLGPNVGIPSICCPDINTGRVPLPAVAETGYPRANTMLHRGYIQSWNVIFERKLPFQILGTLGYVGSQSVRGFAFLDINAGQIPGAGDAGRPLFAKFGRTTATREWDGRTESTYHALQTSINRRLTDGLLLKGAYTFSRAMDMANYGDVGDATYFDTTAFKRVTEVRFGNVGRNSMRGPGQRNLDLSLFRTFKLPGTVDLQFRAEGFNITDTPHFSNPNGNVNSSNF